MEFEEEERRYKKDKLRRDIAIAITTSSYYYGLLTFLYGTNQDQPWPQKQAEQVADEPWKENTGEDQEEDFELRLKMAMNMMMRNVL